MKTTIGIAALALATALPLFVAGQDDAKQVSFDSNKEPPSKDRRRLKPRPAASAETSEPLPPTLAPEQPALPVPRMADIGVKPLIVDNCQVKMAEVIQVPSEIAGKLARVYVQEGSIVKKGDLLAKLDDKNAQLEKELKERQATNEASVSSAAKRVEHYQIEWDRQVKLRASGTASQEDVDRARTQLELASEEYKDARVKFLLADIEFEKAEEAFKRHSILSPVNGQVVERLKHPDEAVQAYEPILHVMRTDRVRIVGQIDARQADKIRAGAVVEVFADRSASEEWSRMESCDVHCVRVLPGDRRIAYGCADGRVAVVNLSSGAVEREIKSGTKNVRALAVCPGEPNLLLAGGDDGALRTWNLSDGGEIRPSLKAHPSESPILAIVVDPTDSKRGWTGHADGRIHAWDFAAGKVVKTFSPEGRDKAHNNAVTCLALSPDRSMLLSVGDDATAQVWKADAGERIAFYDGRRATTNMQVRYMNFSPDGAEVPFNSDGLLQFRKLTTGLPADEVEGGGRNFACLAMFAPIPGLVLAGRDGGDLQLWRRTTEGRPPRLARTFRGPRNAAVQHADFATDGSFFAACADDRTVRIHRVPSVKTLDGERYPARVTFVSPQAGATGAFEFHAELNNSTSGFRGNTTATVVVYPE